MMLNQSGIKNMIRRALSFASILAVAACANEPTAPVLDDIEPDFAKVTAAEKCLALAQRLDRNNVRLGDRTAGAIHDHSVAGSAITVTEYHGAAWNGAFGASGTRTVTYTDATHQVIVSVSWDEAFTHRLISWSSDDHAEVESWRKVEELPSEQPPLKICSV